MNPATQAALDARAPFQPASSWTTSRASSCGGCNPSGCGRPCCGPTSMCRSITSGCRNVALRRPTSATSTTWTSSLHHPS